jgi:hypothetical protein
MRAFRTGFERMLGPTHLNVDRNRADTVYGAAATVGLIVSVLLHASAWCCEGHSGYATLSDMILFFGIIFLGIQAYRSAQHYYDDQDDPSSVLPGWAKITLVLIFLYGALNIAIHLLTTDEMRVWTDGESYFSMGNDRAKKQISKEIFELRASRFRRSSSSPLILFYASLCIYFFFHRKRNEK